MNGLRVQLQTAFSEINDIEIGVAIPDGLVKEGVTYFSYELEEAYVDQDFNNNNFMRVTLTGRLVRRESTDENTLMILDSALEEIKTVLKSMNFDYSYRDVSAFTDGFKKIAVDGTTHYYEMNNELI